MAGQRNALVVEPDALEDEREELALGGGVCLLRPEDREVLEHLAGLLEDGEWAGGELGKLGVDCFAAGHVLGAGEVAKLIEIACAGEALFERGAPLGGVGGICGGGASEAAEDLVADSGGGLEVGDEIDELRLDNVGVDERLVAGVLGATGGAVVAGHELAPDGGAVHLSVAALAAGDPAQQVAV